jgi:Cu2+-exporting ATPase
LATPLAVVVAIGRAARRGILIKGGDALEALAQRGVIVLDKTGTLTTGTLRVVEYHGERALRPFIAAAERLSTHPIAQALAEGLAHPTDPEVAGEARISHSLGGGVEATVGGERLAIGSVRFVMDHCGTRPMSPDLSDAVDRAASAGLTPVIVAHGGAPSAVVILGDEPKPDARATIDDLRRAGWRPMILSGDDPRVVRSLARRLGLAEKDAVGGATPEEKVSRVRALAARGSVVMVGDGVNDAAALAAATVGVAVHGGAEAALTAASVSLTRADLSAVTDLIRGARATTAAIRRNLLVSLGYNVFFGGLAIAGLVNPLVAAVLMPLSSVTVLVLSFRTRAFRAQPERAKEASAA